MKREDMLDIIGGIDEDFIEEATPKTFAAKRRRPTMRRLVSAAACFLVAAGIGAGAFAWQTRPLPDLSGRFETKYVAQSENYFNKNSAQTTISAVNAYMGISYNSNYYKRKSKLPDENVAGAIKSGVVSEQGNVLEIYGVKGISESCAIALKSWDGSYDIYASMTYLPKTTGEWNESMSLEKTAKITSVQYLFTDENGDKKTVEFRNFDESRVYSLILGSGAEKISVCYGEADDTCLILKMHIPSLGDDGIYVYVTSSGDVYAGMPECRGTYSIGKNAVRRLVNYFAENCEGKELSYIEG